MTETCGEQGLFAVFAPSDCIFARISKATVGVMLKNEAQLTRISTISSSRKTDVQGRLEDEMAKDPSGQQPERMIEAELKSKEAGQSSPVILVSDGSVPGD